MSVLTINLSLFALMIVAHFPNIACDDVKWKDLNLSSTTEVPSRMKGTGRDLHIIFNLN